MSSSLEPDPPPPPTSPLLAFSFRLSAQGAASSAGPRPARHHPGPLLASCRARGVPRAQRRSGRPLELRELGVSSLSPRRARLLGDGGRPCLAPNPKGPDGRRPGAPERAPGSPARPGPRAPTPSRAPGCGARRGRWSGRARAVRGGVCVCGGGGEADRRAAAPGARSASDAPDAESRLGTPMPSRDSARPCRVATRHAPMPSRRRRQGPRGRVGDPAAKGPHRTTG